MDDIHFVDQQLLSAVFFAGALPLLPALSWSQKEGAQKKFLTICFGMLLVPATVLFFSKSIWWPVTNSQIKHHVESFDHARFSTSSWRSWEIVASWSIESGLNPDLSVPRKLFEKEISGQLDRTNGFIDGVASRTGLVPAERLLQLVDFDPQLQSLLRSLPQHQITSLNQHDWVIRTSAQLGQLSSDQKDLLEQRLLVTMNKEIVAEHAELEDVLRVTELLEIIGRPINLDQYRNQVHAFLREFHTKSGGGFQPAGGFRSYRTSRTGSLEPTAYAVELMQTYGVPDGLDLNWIRSYLRPLAFRPAPDNFVAAVALDRLNHLPGVKFPTWLDYLYYERSLVMAVLLVAICIYATLSSPTLRDESTADGLTST